MARNRKVTSNGMATVAVLGIVACSSFLLGSVTQHYFGRATRRAPRSNTLHNHTELMGPDLVSMSVADSAAATIPAAADSGERKVRSLEDATRAAFYRLPPAAGADANLSKTYVRTCVHESTACIAAPASGVCTSRCHRWSTVL
jgi:hypothetical protein